ncbi:CxC2 domain-containing protein [Mycena indigotica]|uniref:CxC2 domain-containing protein n=1 Tax=Mycena indigotica TaxID=2126181 RepID=A0A8H6T0R6_9AGAR|nr:CxC2 domain-containing protein [Mycena indigotica]KAF7307360.1 CxC2 domain-containing protein [Mycena indigotica]
MRTSTRPTSMRIYLQTTQELLQVLSICPPASVPKRARLRIRPKTAGLGPRPDATMDEVDALATSVSSFDVDLDEVVTKRKRYESDDPMEVWKSVSGLFLDEIVRHDGLGQRTQCAVCPTKVNQAGQRFFRCRQCGVQIFCESCVKKQHQWSPLHTIQEWTGSFWTEVSLYHSRVESGGRSGLGAMYQLGHSGATCPFPGNRRSMVVIGVNGIFVVDIQYCDCHNTNGSDMLQQLLRNGWYPATTINPATCATFNVLELFRLLRTIGNLNVHDFMRTLERSGDPTLTCDTPDRYKAFGRMARQFDFLKRMKRGRVASEADGMATTPPGSGLGYFVESSSHKDHLRSYVKEKDVSSCVAFAALLQKETRLTTGLRVSGVAGCVCARHGLVRARGLGDLQKGERYANVDWIVACTLWTERLMEYGFAYDIVCQWMINFFKRLAKIREGSADTTTLTTDFDDLEVVFGVPVWHAGAHDLQCRAHLALAYLLGMGKTDGEAMERIWASLNPASWATKEMGEGGRHDVLEDKVDHLNFEKNLGLGRVLSRKLIVAISNAGVKATNLRNSTKASTKSSENNGELSWTTGIKTRPNQIRLFCRVETLVSGWTWLHVSANERRKPAGPTEREIVQDLKKEELEEVRAGRIPVLEGKMTVVAFIKAGLQLQNLQRRIRAALKNKSLTADRASQIQELRLSLVKQTQAFQKLQLTYMPGVEGLRQADDTKRNPDQPTPPPEDTKLYLPSDLTHTERLQACVQRVVDTEVNLRRGQCTDALVALRAKLFAQTHMIWFRDRNLVGQKARTRSVTLMGQAIVKLKGPAFAPEFQKLEDADVNCRVVEENDIEAAQRLRGADGSRGARSEPSTKRLRGKVSWIWQAEIGSEAEEMHDAVRVEWSKARARRARWNEEVELIREEMKRVLRSLRFAQRTKVANGLVAYALRQVELHKRIAEGFYTEWRKSVSDAVKEVMAQDGALYRHLLDGDSENIGENRVLFEFRFQMAQVVDAAEKAEDKAHAWRVAWRWIKVFFVEHTPKMLDPVASNSLVNATREAERQKQTEYVMAWEMLLLINADDDCVTTPDAKAIWLNICEWQECLIKEGHYLQLQSKHFSSELPGPSAANTNNSEPLVGLRYAEADEIQVITRNAVLSLTKISAVLTWALEHAFGPLCRYLIEDMLLVQRLSHSTTWNLTPNRRADVFYLALRSLEALGAFDKKNFENANFVNRIGARQTAQILMLSLDITIKVCGLKDSPFHWALPVMSVDSLNFLYRFYKSEELNAALHVELRRKGVYGMLIDLLATLLTIDDFTELTGNADWGDG